MIWFYVALVVPIMLFLLAFVSMFCGSGRDQDERARIRRGGFVIYGFALFCWVVIMTVRVIELGISNAP